MVFSINIAYADTKREIIESLVGIILIDRINDSFIEKIISSASASLEGDNGGAKYNSKIAGIGRSLTDSTSTSKKKKENYSFELLDTSKVNAYSLGRNIYISEGLVDLLGGDEDMLAGVLAHELAHTRRKHSVSSFKRFLKLNLVILPKIGDNGDDEQLAKGFASYLISAGFSRDQEREADKLAVEYLKKSSYSPFGLTMALERLKSQEKYSMPDFLSTHPNTNDRINATKKFASKDYSQPQLTEDENSKNIKGNEERNARLSEPESKYLENIKYPFAQKLHSQFLGSGEWDIVKFDNQFSNELIFSKKYDFFAYIDGKQFCRLIPKEVEENYCRFETETGVEFPKTKFKVMMKLADDGKSGSYE
ncbi:MAG: Peptidase M48 Ste24p [Berkelbacteria bacterium GW2011_GWA2_35_9]|uniref:Peptidase M48 Ste24p n=1 Tax=Berkelbacteria bacterium GW2011_GWA2_35_9 TaxID=1618333 RepID=A0A0G0D5I3_9BACT|nr:MAG: Peptidase M48 Ste24p [Berkelbacteria bacterium GW2011_GWA2_35_9]